MAVSPRICPSSPAQLSWKVPHGSLRASYVISLWPGSKHTKWCAAFLYLEFSGLTKAQYLKESTQNYQWGLRVKTVSWNLNQHFLQKKHSTWICNVLKIQLQEAVGSRLCRYLFSFVTQPTAGETEPSSLTSLTQLTSYYVCMNLLLIIIYSHDAVINCL